VAKIFVLIAKTRQSAKKMQFLLKSHHYLGQTAGMSAIFRQNVSRG
jgi:hypothetical protein